MSAWSAVSSDCALSISVSILVSSLIISDTVSALNAMVDALNVVTSPLIDSSASVALTVSASIFSSSACSASSALSVSSATAASIASWMWETLTPSGLTERTFSVTFPFSLYSTTTSSEVSSILT